MSLIYSIAGRELTESFEGCKLEAYQDVRGVWTIGYGHTGSVSPGDTCTQQEADDWLQEDIQWAAQVVVREVKRDLTQGEFDALVDFVYNVGSGNFASSTLLKMINAGDFVGAAAQFEHWDVAGGKHIAGLLRRRVAEEQEFLS